MPATTSLAEIADAGEHYCGEHWTRLQEKHKQVEEKDLLKYCFSTAYIVALMHDSLGIGMRDDRYVEYDNSPWVSITDALSLRPCLSIRDVYIVDLKVHKAFTMLPEHLISAASNLM